MKKLIYALLICLLLPSAGQAAYLIKLKNKGSYTVHEYWEEGRMVVFKAYGGTISIPRDKIESIADLKEGSEAAQKMLPAEAPEPEENVAAPAASEEPDASPSLAPDSVKTEDGVLDSKAVKRYMDQKLSLVERLKKELLIQKREIDSQKADHVLERRKAKIGKVRADIEALGREVAEKNSGALPGWWNNIPVPAETLEQP